MKSIFSRKNSLSFLSYFIGIIALVGQTKVDGKIQDSKGEPIPFANIIFENSTEGTISDENGKFYLESPTQYKNLKVQFLGFESKIIPLQKKTTYGLVITLQEAASTLGEVLIYKGKTSKKKDNPAIVILNKIWKNKRQNGVKRFKQYQYDKYEKLEFDLNTIDSSYMKKRIFRGMEFIFKDIDTSRITGKTYLPIYLNEASSKVYGDNESNLKKEVLIGNRNAGFKNDQTLIELIKSLYSEYDVYDNYLKFFNKSFTSPLSKPGINVYNYVLSDSAYIDNKWCYNISYYPRRKNELTFKGDFWVNDTTWAIKDINLEVTKSANINWIKDLYIEQKFDVVNDSTFLISRDYFQSDFTFAKKEGSRGVYGKRTTLYDNYKFNLKKDEKFYTASVDLYNHKVYNRSNDFWNNVRLEKLNKDERKVYKLLDTLQTVKAFKRLYRVSNILISGYADFKHFGFGPVFNTVGFNAIEGWRLRLGGRTFFNTNDRWRLSGYGAYGFRDRKIKYGLSGKYLIDRKSRLIASIGFRKDVEQLGASLSTTNNVQDRNLASSSIVATGDNNRLTALKLAAISLEFEPKKNLIFGLTTSFKTLKPADRNRFSLDFFNPRTNALQSEIKQTEIATSVTYFINRKTTGYGVDKKIINKKKFATLFLNYTKGINGILESDFDYEKIQFMFGKPWTIGGFGRLRSTFELGKTFGKVPLGLLSIIPGNQTYLSIFNTFPLLNFYEFVTDTYATMHLDHNFNGRILSKIPLLKRLNLREFVGIRAAWGSLSNQNIQLNLPTNERLFSPSDKVYWEYSFGVGNIFKLLRIDFHFRGNYFNNPDARKFAVTGDFGFFF